MLPENPTRVSGQRRVLDPATVRTLAVIDTAQRASLTLSEIKTLLSARARRRIGDRTGSREIAERKLPEIAALIERTELVRGWLECAARCGMPRPR